jgi:uncharacterized protein YcfL
MKTLIIALLALTVAGCSATNPTLVVTESRVIVPDKSMFRCPVVDRFPKLDTLTDQQVSLLIIELYRNNQMCKNSIVALEAFIERTSKLK